MYTGFWWGNLSEREHLEDLGVDGRIILRWIFSKWDGGIDWIDLAQDRDGWGWGNSKRGNEPSGSIKRGKFLD